MIRTQVELQPRRRAMPPITPAIMRSLSERVSALVEVALMAGSCGNWPESSAAPCVRAAQSHGPRWHARIAVQVARRPAATSTSALAGRQPALDRHRYLALRAAGDIQADVPAPEPQLGVVAGADQPGQRTRGGGRHQVVLLGVDVQH